MMTISEFFKVYFLWCFFGRVSPRGASFSPFYLKNLLLTFDLKWKSKNLFLMANPDQKTILIEQAYEEIKEICNKFQEDSGASDMEVKTLLRELARVWEKEN